MLEQSTEELPALYLTGIKLLGIGKVRRYNSVIQRLMWPIVVIVLKMLRDNPVELPKRKADKAIQAFTFEVREIALNVSALSWTANGSPDYPTILPRWRRGVDNPLEELVKARCIFTIIIAY